MTDRQTLVTGRLVREACRSAHGRGKRPAWPPVSQANLVILPRDVAGDFLLFCQRNPKPCPLLDVTEPGSPIPLRAAPGADLRTDLPRYRLWREGRLVEELSDIQGVWQDDFVSFAIGCSFTFEAALQRAGIPVRHIDLGVNVPMYRTNISCQPAGIFHGPLVVSMRPLKSAAAIRAVQITSRYPSVHGAPVHIGLPAAIGIDDLSQPDFGDGVPVAPDELPVFWACGVTPQAVAEAARPPLMVTHSPGCMFVTDLHDEELAVG